MFKVRSSNIQIEITPPRIFFKPFYCLSRPKTHPCTKFQQNLLFRFQTRALQRRWESIESKFRTIFRCKIWGRGERNVWVYFSEI